MGTLRRVGLFLATNIAILAVISILLSIFNVRPYLEQHRLNYQSLLIYAAIIGFTGSFISLFISKWMAKYTFGIKMIQTPSTEAEQWLTNTVRKLANQSSIGMPEIGMYDSQEPNAFATGWSRNRALVAVSSGLLNAMNQEEVEGVLGHEISHVANGDMVTLALIQGVVNTFVIFFARIAAFMVTQFFRKDEEESVGGNFAFYGVSIIFELIFGILASTIVFAFSRYREFRADAGSARLVGKDKMISALQRLQAFVDMPAEQREASFSTMKISDNRKLLGLFSSHPPLAKRIAALQRGQY
ncbi:MAG: protease HtpX [Gammaproteobacteria bacterium]